MLFRFFLLFFLCASTVKLSTVWPTTYMHPTTVAVEEKLSPLWLVATPDYPVAAGHRVHLHCSALTIPDQVIWSWQHMENQTWKEVGIGRDLTLTEPEQSGLYRCCATSMLPEKKVSSNHTVFIISMHATVGENLGIAAFALCLMALIISLAVLFRLCWQRIDDSLTTSNTSAQGFPVPEKSPKDGLPPTDNDGDVYMNYTGTNQAYSDLDPTNMNEDNVYSGLS